MSRFLALMIFVGCFIIIGFFVPLLTMSFVDVSHPDSNSGVYKVVLFFQYALDFISLAPPFSLMPAALSNYYDTSLASFTYLPDMISIPLMLIMFFSFCYVIITLVPTVGG